MFLKHAFFCFFFWSDYKADFVGENRRLVRGGQTSHLPHLEIQSNTIDFKHSHAHITLYLLVNLNCTKTQFRVNADSQGAVCFIVLPVSHYRADVIKVS